jgi:hypothetical protein
MEKERHDKDDQEDEEQRLRDGRGGRSNAAEAQQARNQSQYEKRDCPAQHVRLLISKPCRDETGNGRRSSKGGFSGTTDYLLGFDGRSVSMTANGDKSRWRRVKDPLRPAVLRMNSVGVEP